MRIRTAGVIAASMLCLVGAAACGDKKTSTSAGPKASAATGELIIWADDKRSAALKPFADKFGQENGVTVKIQAISKDQQTTFLTASQQGSGPDVMVGAHDWIGNLVQNGAIDPVQLSDAQKSGLQPGALKAVTFNSQTYGVPYATENIGLIRNTDLAPTAPATIEDVVAQGKKLVAEKKASEVLCLQSGPTGDAYHAYPLYASAGGYLFGAAGNGDLDPKDLGVGKPGSVAAFEKLRALGEKGDGALKRSISPDNSVATFTGKKCAFLVSGPWATADAKKAGINYDITAVPPFKGGKDATPFLGVQTFYVAAKGKNKALAQEFVTNYVTTPELAVALYQADPRPPALTSALDQVKANDPDVAKWAEAGKNAIPLPAIPEMAAIWEPFGKAEAAVIGGADAKSTVDAAAKTISAAITK
ncbi:sugar ABC transporter substrate-binding protein [Actinoplanes sp. SE50]|uniref:sugar ABC transporter substrate-binding protein n=1 Tax=unclassified Actinoplanes TaxID=2626549 RepID=UPI00023ED2F0|nr:MULTISPECIES: maltose ABC transporter substrate-binding protein [unclassified Actinoplanes]AEV87284.1 Maltotriose-binding protein [Actinoplanes sp. SE50/110]ATO85684.1 sugar ABC transporter substrate-binding protein [Actinoplanes sp. SE50]SLM03097.1 ABC-type maltose/maltodextrin transporter, substrate-binding lipoprotein [Actinoplanes sp. SE50/110]